MSRRRDNKPAVKEQVVRTVVGVEDMVLLPDIKDTGIVANLKLRLQSELIYTSIGHVLVACNPYKWLPIYTEDTMKRYTMQQRVDVPPHIFATAEAAYRNMIQEEDNQCVIISGESGAGKTEASKQIQSYIAKVSGGGSKVEQTKKVFLESNPVLEAFGNAKTLRNNNSSRFGKYFELKFDRFGAPIGGLVTNYLLEKSRICNPGRGERNFHIFYQLLNSQMAETLGLQKPAAEFAYLNSAALAGGKNNKGAAASCEDKVDGVDDSKEMEITLSAMKSVGIKNAQIKSILSLIGAILHLGNIEFDSVQVEGVEGCKVSSRCSSSLKLCCDLLGVDARQLSHCLTFRELQTMAPGGKTDTYQIPQHQAQAAARRDAIAKAIYEQLFDLIVERINVALDPAAAADVQNNGVDLDVDVLSIGVLDIYGFEVFDHNGFEQLCINYVNEKLQQIFIELTLNAEQLEYEAEGIAWQPIPFFNNKIVCDLLDGARPSGLFRVLDDTCKTMHGTKAGMEVDKKFLDSARQLHGNNAHFRPTPSSFVIKHYAGEVTYDAGKLGESNKDALDNDLLGIIKSSSDKLLQHLFRRLEQDPEDGGTAQGGGKKAGAASPSGAPSAGTRIRQQCQLLVTALMECSPHYVRCVKSNDLKQALTMDNSRVQHQVKYLGLAENIKVRRAGFAYRSEFHRFLDRFAILAPSTYPEWRGTDLNGCKEILKSIQQKKLPGSLSLKEEVQLGKSKLFIRTPEMYFAIEQLRERSFERFAERIQRAYRRYRSSRELVSLQNVMHSLYAEHEKTRRRESIYCPYAGDSLHQLNSSFLDHGSSATATAAGKKAARKTVEEEEEFRERFKESMYRIIDHYSVSETVLFVDPNAAQLLKPPAHHLPTPSSVGAPGWNVAPRVVVLTNGALYVMEKLTAEGWRHMQQTAGVPAAECASKTPPGMLLLRRRIPLPKSKSNTENGTLSGVVLSKLADCCVLLQVTPPNVQPLTQKQVMQNVQASWAKDDSSPKCSVTNIPFSMFNRRHHCRVTGSLVCANASMHTQLLPDLQLHTAQRISDPVIGLVSTDPLEDVVILTSRKSEFAALLATQCLGLNSTKNTAKPSAATLGGFITFHNTLKPRPNFSVPGNISLIPAVEIAIHSVPNTGGGSGKNSQKGRKNSTNSPSSPSSGPACAPLAVLEDFSAVLESGGKLNVTCSADGITHQAVLERRERQLQRQKKAEKRRRREEKDRQERRVAREHEREAVRLERLAERKAKKLAEREARRRRAEASAGVATSKAGGGVKASNSLTRMAEAAQGGASKSNSNSGTTTPRSGNSSPVPPAGGAVERPSGASKGSAARGAPMEKQNSGGNAELMAAMARRRAKAQEE